MIVVCYAAVAVCHQIDIIRRIFTRTRLILIVAVLTLLAAVFLERLHIPGRIIIVIALYLGVYFNAAKIHSWSTNASKQSLWIVSFVLNLVVLILFFTPLFDDNHRVIRDLFVAVDSILLLCVTLSLSNVLKRNRVISFISNYSFEIYLIHHPLILGCFSLLNDKPYWEGISLVVLVSCVSAVVLQYLSKLLHEGLKLIENHQ